VAAYVRKAFPNADAGEITQDTLRKAFRHQAQVLELADPWPWLALTARNTAYNCARDEKARGASAEIPCAEIYATEPNDVSVEDRAILREQVSLAFRAMDALTKDQRALIELMVRDGLTVSEAGRRLGYAEATARQHLCRLRSRLRTRFAALGGSLAVVPLGFLRLARRGTRTVTLPATMSLAAGTTVALTAIVGGGLALLPSGADAAATAAYQTKTRAPAAHHASTAAPQLQVAARTRPRTGVQPTLPVTPVTHLFVTKSPTHGGHTANGGVTVTTPVGVLYVGDDQQQSKGVCVANAVGDCG